MIHKDVFLIDRDICLCHCARPDQRTTLVRPVFFEVSNVSGISVAMRVIHVTSWFVHFV